jgi:ParB-like chromosome segregation protein Spo0J
VYLRHDQIHGDRYNIREKLPGVLRMAWSLYQHGLLENLVVIEADEETRARHGVEYELKAGSRRFAAIGLLLDGVDAPPHSKDRQLGVRWQWPRDKTFPCRVLGSSGNYEHLIENVERSDPYPWEIGRRLNEILSAGVTARELGTRLGRSNGYVTRYAHIGRGLSPELVELLVADRADLRLGELTRYASMLDRYGDPDGPAQVAAYQASRGRRRRRAERMNPESYRATLRRLQYLRSDMPIPMALRPIVAAVLSYIEGGERPNFRALEAKMLTFLRPLSSEPADPDECETT